MAIVNYYAVVILVRQGPLGSWGGGKKTINTSFRAPWGSKTLEASIAK